MKLVGIWMDKEKAYIINVKEKGEEITTVQSNIETFNIHGGSGTRLKGGPQDVVQDSRYLERNKHQFKTYAKEIVQYLSGVDKLVIFGPAEAGQKFQKELLENYKTIHTKLEEVIKTDSMTQNQHKALIRNYFKKYHESYYAQI